MLDFPELLAPKNSVMGAIRIALVSFQHLKFWILSCVNMIDDSVRMRQSLISSVLTKGETCLRPLLKFAEGKPGFKVYQTLCSGEILATGTSPLRQHFSLQAFRKPRSYFWMSSSNAALREPSSIDSRFAQISIDEVRSDWTISIGVARPFREAGHVDAPSDQHSRSSVAAEV